MSLGGSVVLCVEARVWTILLIFAAYPTIAFIRSSLRRHRRRKRDLCVACAYDLTGKVTGACGECGKEIAAP